MSRKINILEGAYIISDAHYSKNRPELLEFFRSIASKQLEPTQLILMGDMFDSLFGEIPYTHKINRELIGLINDISNCIEVVYLEGNHDFNLKNIFKKAKVFSISQQPIEVNYSGKKILLSHGDIESDIGYKIYTSIIRNRFVLYILNTLNSLSSNYIIRKLDDYLCKKDDCKDFRGFEEYIAKRLLGKYECDIFMEGHFHQNKSIEFDEFLYINLGAFACNQRYFIVKSSQEVELLQEKIFSEGK